MDFKIAVLAGDGIGPEISAVGVDVMTAVCEKFGTKRKRRNWKQRLLTWAFL